MLKKAAAVTAIAAGITLAGTPAFAVAGEGHDYGAPHAEYTQVVQDVYNQQDVNTTVANDDDVTQNGLVNLNDTNICQVQVLSELVSVIPIASNNDELNCLDVQDDDVTVDANAEAENAAGTAEAAEEE